MLKSINYRETGLLVFGKRDQSYFKEVIESFNVNKIEFKLYNPEEIRKKYANLTMGPDVWGCYDPAAGVLMADKCLKTVWVI